MHINRRKRKPDWQFANFLNKRYIPYIGGGVLIFLLAIASFSYIYQNKGVKISGCDTQKQLNLSNVPLSITTDASNNGFSCYYFEGRSGQQLIINGSNKITLISPKNQMINLQGSAQEFLRETGFYGIQLQTDKEKPSSSTTITLLNQELNINAQTGIKHPSIYNSPPAAIYPQSTPSFPVKVSYNVKQVPSFQPDSKLQQIVNDIIYLVQSKGLPTDKISISLINLNGGKCCGYAAYAEGVPRFPASVSKLFWIVALYGYYKEGIIPEGSLSDKETYKMIQDSDNEPASRVLDLLTNTESGENLNPSDLNLWIQKRLAVNYFFQAAGYQNINVSQKNFPVPYLKMDRPEGRDLQIRGNGVHPIRNFLTTHETARLMLDINNNQAISANYSEKIKQLMKRDLRPEVWKQKEYNSIAGFLAESLPIDADCYSKVGWTADSRQDAAIIASPDGKVRYILVIFADDNSFGQDWKIFPQISRMVYDRMINYN